MIEIDALTKACGLLAFEYWTFPSPHFDNDPDSLSAEVDPTPVVLAPEAPPAIIPTGPARTEPRLEPTMKELRPQPEPVRTEPATPAPQSVLREVASALSPALPAARSARPTRAARSAWRAATSPHHPP